MDMFDFDDGKCTAGRFLERVSSDKLVAVDEVIDKSRGRLVRLVYQYHPMGRIYITFCEKQGNLPIYMENRATTDEKGIAKASNDESDYRKILSASTTEWRKHRDVWYPVRVKLESVQSRNRLKPDSDRELSFYWYFDEKMTPKSLEEMLPTELYDLIVDNAQIKP